MKTGRWNKKHTMGGDYDCLDIIWLLYFLDVCLCGGYFQSICQTLEGNKEMKIHLTIDIEDEDLSEAVRKLISELDFIFNKISEK